MDSVLAQQIFEQIKKSNKILIMLPEYLTADHLASGLALNLFLIRLHKDVVLASAGEVPSNLKFLSSVETLRHQITIAKSFVVTVDTSTKKLEEVSYQTAGDKAHIYLKSVGEEFAPQDLSFSQEKFPVDLLIILGAASLEDLGELYEQHTDLFFETAKINVDNKAANEYFGSINLVDITATSVAEILAGLLQSYEQELIDEDIATCLLAGIIDKTGSFQHAHTTPKAFIKASELVNLGGRQQEIIKHIYKTKSLPLLKLWGRALARMKIQEQNKIVHSVLNFTDFEKAEATESELLPALKELVDNVGGYKIIALLAEPNKGRCHLYIAVHQQFPVEQLLQQLGGQAKRLAVALGDYQVVGLTFGDGSLEQLEDIFLQAIKILPV